MSHYDPATYSVHNSVGYLLRRSAALLREQLESGFEAAGITFVQWATLILVRDNPGTTPGEVCRDLRHGADRLRRGYCADLDRLHGHVFQYASRLVVDLLCPTGNDGFRIGGVLRGHCRQDGKGMHAQGRARDRVGRQTIGARRIKRAKNKGDWQRIFRHCVSPAAVP